MRNNPLSSNKEITLSSIYHKKYFFMEYHVLCLLFLMSKEIQFERETNSSKSSSYIDLNQEF